MLGMYGNGMPNPFFRCGHAHHTHNSHYRIVGFVAEDSVKCMSLSGFFGMQILPHSISSGVPSPIFSDSIVGKPTKYGLGM